MFNNSYYYCNYFQFVTICLLLINIIMTTTKNEIAQCTSSTYTWITETPNKTWARNVSTQNTHQQQEESVLCRREVPSDERSNDHQSARTTSPLWQQSKLYAHLMVSWRECGSSAAETARTDHLPALLLATFCVHLQNVVTSDSALIITVLWKI